DNPEEAFEVLTYLTGPASMDLLAVYGGMPTRPGDQAAFFAALDEKYSQGVNWDVARAHVAFADVPSHETPMPNHNRANDRPDQVKSLLDRHPAPDEHAEVDRLTSDLQVLIEKPLQPHTPGAQPQPGHRPARPVQVAPRQPAGARRRRRDRPAHRRPPGPLRRGPLAHEPRRRPDAPRVRPAADPEGGLP